MDTVDNDFIRLGKIAGAYGVRGWVRVSSDTEPADGILHYRPWRLLLNGEWVEVGVAEGRRHSRGVVVRLDGCNDRNAAVAYSGVVIAVPRTQMPALGSGEFYWFDLIGLSVVTRGGEVLGKVNYLMQTGANDVLVLTGERERLIPFINDEVVLNVNLADGRITVDWDPEF
ncbi:MAG TPA: ribosome maturation factor RimM [Gammaproteobacteria bacterium]